MLSPHTPRQPILRTRVPPEHEWFADVDEQQQHSAEHSASDDDVTASDARRGRQRSSRGDNTARSTAGQTARSPRARSQPPTGGSPPSSSAAAAAAAAAAASSGVVSAGASARRMPPALARALGAGALDERTSAGSSGGATRRASTGSMMRVGESAAAASPFLQRRASMTSTRSVSSLTEDEVYARILARARPAPPPGASPLAPIGSPRAAVTSSAAAPAADAHVAYSFPRDSRTRHMSRATSGVLGAGPGAYGAAHDVAAAMAAPASAHRAAVMLGSPRLTAQWMFDPGMSSSPRRASAAPGSTNSGGGVS